MTDTPTRSRWSSYAGRIALATSALFFVCTLGANLWYWVGPPTWGPLLRSPKSSFDFGRLPPGEVRRCAFILRNEGRERLRLDRVVSSCGCLVTDFDRGHELGPGESITLRVQIDFTGMSGRVVRDIAVEWGPGHRPPLVLTVSASVEPSS